MFKIVLVFLMVMLIISMAASAITRFLRGDEPPPRRVDKSQTHAKCAHCGRPVLGTAPCVCGKG